MKLEVLLHTLMHRLQDPVRKQKQQQKFPSYNVISCLSMYHKNWTPDW